MKRDLFKYNTAGTALFVATLSLTFLALLVWGELTAWQAAVARIEQETQNEAQSLAQHADDTLELAQAPLAGLVRDLEVHGTSPPALAELRKRMASTLAVSSRFKDLFVFDEQGRWIATSADHIPDNANNSDREYFQIHRQSSSRAVLLGKPIKSKSSGQWVISVTRRFDHPDGSFAGVVAVTFESRYFSDYYGAAPVGVDGAIMLMRGDGVVMARSPYTDKFVGINVLAPQGLFARQLHLADAGAYHYVSPVDGVARIAGYYRSWRSQMVVLVAVSEREAMAAWASEARARWGAGILVIAASGLLALRLALQSRRRRQGEEILARTQAEFQLLAENSSDMAERFDADDIRRFVSPGSRGVLGIDAAELLGTSLYETVHPDDRDYVIEANKRLRDGLSSQTITFRAFHKSGREVWLESNLSALPRSGDGEWTGSVAATRDVTTRKDLEVRLAAMATVDGLTGLSNRHAFDKKFAAALRRARREKTALSVLMIDADHFKHFNDTYGHIAGDNCLRSISATIAGAARRPSNMVARFGGEEIVVLLPNTDQPAAYALARRMCSQIQALGIPHEKNTPWNVVTTSMGVATFTGDEPAEYSETDLLGAADRAMYQAKITGRNCAVAADERSHRLARLTG